MARRGLTGQLNMFDLFNSLDEPGEVEMVSLVPEFEDEPETVDEPEIVGEPETVDEPEIVGEPETVDEPEIVDEPEPVDELPVSIYEKKEENVVMSRSYERDGKRVEIAYLNYNKVRIQCGEKEPEIKVFATSKEAVDYYVKVMQEYEIDE